MTLAATPTLNGSRTPVFAVQLELFPNELGTITLVCGVCHRHTTAHEDLLTERPGDRLPCSRCGAIGVIPNKE